LGQALNDCGLAIADCGLASGANQRPF